MKIAKTITTIRVVLLPPELDFVDCGDVLRFELFVGISVVLVVLVLRVVTGLPDVALVGDSTLVVMVETELVVLALVEVLVVVELVLELLVVEVVEVLDVVEVEEVVDW